MAIFRDIGRVILVDFTPHGFSYYHSMLTGVEAVHCKRPGLLSKGLLLSHSNA